ncbi:MAG: BrnT family toxin [Pseudomonadota bacterium]
MYVQMHAHSRILAMKANGFDWDRGNLFKNEAKHGLSRETIETFFRQPLWVGPDPKHSSREERLIAQGVLPDGRHVIAAFTIRETGGMRLIRPISARRMNGREIERYEEVLATNDQ